MIRDHGAKASVALNPATPLEALDWVYPDLDMVLLMSVNPGWGGQSFIAPVFDKIRSLRQRLQDRGIEIPIQVDGGINLKTIARASLAGTTHFVAGSAVFTVKAGDELDEKDRLETYRKNINGLIEEATKDQLV